MADIELVELWRERLEGFDESGLSAAEWCDNKGITLDRFYHWRKRFRNDNNPAQQPQGWAVLQVAKPSAQPAGTSAITLRVGPAAIEVPPGFDTEHLRAILRALESATC